MDSCSKIISALVVVNKFRKKQKTFSHTEDLNMTQASIVVRNFFRLIENVYCHQIFTFDEAKNGFSIQRKCCVFYFTFLKEVVTFVVYSILSLVLLIADYNCLEISETHQTVFQILFLVTANHSFSLFVFNYLKGSNFLRGLNQIHGIQKVVESENEVIVDVFKKHKKRRKSGRMDVSLVYIFRFVSIGFLLVSFITPVFLLKAQVDPFHVFLKWTKVNSATVQVVHLLIILGTVPELAHHLGATHLLIMLYCYSMSVCFRQLPYVTTSRKQKTNNKTSRRMWVHLKACGSYVSNWKFQIYSALLIANNQIRSWTNYTFVSVMGSGLLIDVVCNYVIIKMFGRIPPCCDIWGTWCCK